MIVALWVHSKVFANFRLQEPHLRRLRQAFPGGEFVRCETREQFLRALPRAEIVCCFRFKSEWFPKAPRLRRLISPTAGRDWFPEPFPDAVRLELSTFHGRIISETVLGMMLSHTRGLLRAHGLQSAEPWPQQTLEPGLRLLRGSRVTILGFGNIGSHIARPAKLLGARIWGVKRNAAGQVPEYFTDGDRLLEARRLDEALPETDHLVLCLPATAETNGMMDGRRLSLLPPGAGIYNVGRGNAIDEQALADLLVKRPLCEAYLDVFLEEPLSADSPLRALSNCLILPHVSAVAPQYMDLYVEELIERLAEE